MKIFKSLRGLLSTSPTKDDEPSTSAEEHRKSRSPVALGVSASASFAGQDGPSVSSFKSNGSYGPSRSFDRQRLDPKVGGSMRLAVSPVDVTGTSSVPRSPPPQGPSYNRSSNPVSSDRLTRLSRQSPARVATGQPASPGVSLSPANSFRSGDSALHGRPMPYSPPVASQRPMAQAGSPRHSNHYNSVGNATHSGMQTSQGLNMSADYAQPPDISDIGPSERLHMSLNALLKHRHSTGSYNHKIHRTESLKALLHLDQYNFFSDVDVQEAQLQVDTQLLESLLSADDGGMSGESASSRSNVLAVSPALPVAMKRVRWSLKDYVLLRQLHKGYASDVFQAQCKLSGEMVALKVYKLSEQCDLQRVQLYREIRVHSQLQHTNVVQFYAGFLEDERVVLIQEFAGGGDLLKFMAKSGGMLSERQAVNLVLQPFLAALHYLHTQGIVHRDIKPENVLLTDQLELKLADFGLALDLNEERANTRAGTLDYMAPEVLRCPTKNTPDEGKLTAGAAHYQLGADAWAVGVFAYELITGIRPFKAKQNIDIARNIIHAQVAFPDNMSDLAKDFITQALKKHPGDRPTVIEMLNHPWITMFKRRSSVAYASMRSNSIMEMMAAKTPEGPGYASASANAVHAGSGGGGPTNSAAILAAAGGSRRVIAASSEILPRSRIQSPRAEIVAQFL